MIPYLDLLGTPWADMDCRATVRAAYARAGSPLPEGALESPGGGWEPAQRPLRPLDVIACGKGHVSHLAVVIRDRPRLLALTSGAGYGVVAVSVSAIGDVRGIYRRAEA